MNDVPATPPGSNEERTEKSTSAFRTISEVATELDLPQHVLRFWETKFTEIAPMKRAGGRRYYRPEDVDFLRRIKQHLHIDGMTIRGVQKLLREPDVTPATPAPVTSKSTSVEGVDRESVERVLADLTVLRDDLRAALDLSGRA